MKVITNKEIIQSYIMTTARYDFSVDEKRILLRLVETWQFMTEGKKLRGKIDKTLFGDYRCEFPISYFVTENQTNYNRVKDALRALNEKKFEYEDDKLWQIIRIIEKPAIGKRQKVTFELNPKIVEAFLNFTKGHRRFELRVSLSFSSIYSMRFYELLSEQKDPLTYDIETLKEMFGVAEKYKRVNDFIKRVIEPAKTELDKKSPYSFTYKVNKDGRRYKSISFTPVLQPQFIDEEVHQKRLNNKVSLSWDFTNEEKAYLIDTFGFTRKEIINNVELFKTFKAKGHNLLETLTNSKRRILDAHNPKGYLIGVIKTALKTEQKTLY